MTFDTNYTFELVQCNKSPVWSSVCTCW